jgi:DNA-binding transcriptional LysR family regulator
MDLDALRLFSDVARRGSFAAVARERDIDASAVSRGVAALESELGVRLLQRTTRSMILTEAGEIYLSRISGLIDELDQARDEVAASKSEPVGIVRLTASLTFGQVCLAPLLPAFRAAFPRLRLELILSDQNLDLFAERIDLALRLGPTYRADVIGVKLFPTRYLVVASPDYLAKLGTPSAPQELSSRNCLLFSLPDFRSRWLFRHNGRTEEVPISGDLVISNALLLRSAALQGLGPALLADWTVAEDIQSRRLVELFPGYDAAATSFDTSAWLLYPSRSHLPFKVRATIDFLRRNLGRSSKKLCL